MDRAVNKFLQAACHVTDPEPWERAAGQPLPTPVDDPLATQRALRASCAEPPLQPCLRRCLFWIEGHETLLPRRSHLCKGYDG